MTFRFHETIAPQGFLGLLTPKADAHLVDQATRENAAIAENERQSPDPRARHAREDRFDWGAVCRLATARGLHQLWIGCHADTGEEETRFFGAQAEGATTTMLDQVYATCVISSYAGAKSPSWSDLAKTSLTHPGDEQETLYPRSEVTNRHDAIDQPAFRQRLYVRALAFLVSGLELSREASFKRRGDSSIGIEKAACERPRLDPEVDRLIKSSYLGLDHLTR